jgi:hypothetical protein
MPTSANSIKPKRKRQWVFTHLGMNHGLMGGTACCEGCGIGCGMGFGMACLQWCQ